MVHSPEASPLDTSTLLVQKKVMGVSFNMLYYFRLMMNSWFKGWTPSAFVSSRGDRAKTQAARPEDFMDEEDLQELHASRIIVDTTQEMDLTGGTAAELSKQRGGGNDEQE